MLALSQNVMDAGSQKEQAVLCIHSHLSRSWYIEELEKRLQDVTASQSPTQAEKASLYANPLNSHPALSESLLKIILKMAFLHSQKINPTRQHPKQHSVNPP